MPTQITLILGGARSGKSSYAEKLAAGTAKGVLYIATAEAKDEEMAARVRAHRASRPAGWETLEAPQRVAEALARRASPPGALLLDCLTLLVSNILLALEAEPEAAIEAAVGFEIETLLALQKRWDVPLFIVSNEVGLGLVPPYPLGRIYRDLLGRANQRLAAAADTVIFMVAGLPLVVKENNKL